MSTYTSPESTSYFCKLAAAEHGANPQHLKPVSKFSRVATNQYQHVSLLDVSKYSIKA